MAFEIRVPATTSNIGSGYDVLGAALDLCNTFRVTPEKKPESSGLVQSTAYRAAERFGGDLPRFHIHQTERVPRARGLGSSATARVAGLLIYEHLTRPVDQEERLAFLAEEEGHPDNAWAALLGGGVVCGRTARPLSIHPSLSLVLAVPPHEVETHAARAALPLSVPHEDAVFTLQSLATLLLGLQTGDMGALIDGTRDRLHQPWRLPLIGELEDAFTHIRALGAAPFVSGSGSTVAALVDGPNDQVLTTFTHALPSGTQTMTLPFRPNGATVRTIE